MPLPEWLDGVQEPDEKTVADRVFVPLLLAVVGTTFGIGAAKACCGVKYRNFDPHGLLPIGMAVVTSSIAVWSYFNPPPDTAFADRAKRAATPSKRQSL